MSLDHDLEDLMKTTAPAYRPTPGDLGTVMRMGRRRLIRRRVAAAAGSALVLVAVAATTLSLVGVNTLAPKTSEVATRLVTTDGGVAVRVLELAPDASTVVDGVEGFELVTLPDRHLTTFWESVAERLGWYPDLAVYRSADGSRWSRETFRADVFDDVAFIVDALVIDGLHTLLVVWNDESGMEPANRYGILQTQDFVEWSSVDVPASGPTGLPEHLEWSIENAHLIAAGADPAVVTLLHPIVAASARNASWGYDSLTGWFGQTESGEAVRIRLEDVTPIGTLPSRTVVEVFTGTDTGADTWEIVPSGAGEPEEVVWDLAFDGTLWNAVTAPPPEDDGAPARLTVWENAGDGSDWVESFLVIANQARLLGGDLYTVSTGRLASDVSVEEPMHDVSRWEDDGTQVPIGDPVEAGEDGVAVGLAGDEDGLVLASGRTIWRYEPTSDAWSHHDVDFDGFENVHRQDDSLPEDLTDVLSSPENGVQPVRVVGDAVLGLRSFQAEEWWIFQLD